MSQRNDGTAARSSGGRTMSAESREREERPRLGLQIEERDGQEESVLLVQGGDAAPGGVVRE